MLRPADNIEIPSLRSGMYVLRDVTEGVLYVIYWPEETTWDDNAASSVRRNRITFMRYFRLRSAFMINRLTSLAGT